MGLLALILIIPPWYFAGKFVAEKLAPDSSRELRDAISLAVGLGLLSYAIMFIGYLGGFNPLVFWILLIVPFLLSLPAIIKEFRQLPARIEMWREDFRSPADRCLWLSILLLAISALINCGNAAIGWDAAVYHYAFPKILLHEGRLIDFPQNPFSYYPMLAEMLFTLGLALGKEFLAGAMTWLYLFPLFTGLVSIGNSFGNKRIGLFAIILFFGSPLTMDMPFSGLVDLPFLVYCTLAVAYFLESKSKIDLRKTVLIGILIGLASATKHLGILFLIAFVPILFIYLCIKYKSFWKPFVFAWLIVFIALIVPMPWYLRSWIATGDPMFPFLKDLFNLVNATRGSFSIDSFAHTTYPKTVTGFLGYLWYLTFVYTDLRPWFWAINPAYLAFLPVAIILLFLPKSTNGLKHDSTVLLIFLALTTLLINFILSPSFPRYLFPTWICLSILSAWTLHQIYIRWRYIGRFLLPVALILPFLIVLSMGIRRNIEVIPQYFSSRAKVAAIERGFPGYGTFVWSNENLDDSSVIISTDPKVYYLDMEAIIATPGIESHILIPWDSPPSEILANWREIGATHLILDTTLLSIKHGFGIAFFSAILGDRDTVWLDIHNTREGSVEFGIRDILTDEEFYHMSHLGQLPVVWDDDIDRHLLTRERMELFQSWGRDYKMAETILKFIEAGIIDEKFRSGPGGGLRVYSINLPEYDEISLPELPDVTRFCVPFDDFPVQDL